MISFSKRGKYDSARTPLLLYDFIINELGFIDVCLDPQQFDYFKNELPDMAYCNPPFSTKSRFIDKACREARKGKLILMLLPADTSTKWFVKAFFECKASVVFIAGKRIHGKRSKFPSMLLIFDNRQNVIIVRYDELIDFLKEYIRGKA